MIVGGAVDLRRRWATCGRRRWCRCSLISILINGLVATSAAILQREFMQKQRDDRRPGQHLARRRSVARARRLGLGGDEPRGRPAGRQHRLRDHASAGRRCPTGSGGTREDRQAAAAVRPAARGGQHRRLRLRVRRPARSSDRCSARRRWASTSSRSISRAGRCRSSPCRCARWRRRRSRPSSTIRRGCRATSPACSRCCRASRCRHAWRSAAPPKPVVEFVYGPRGCRPRDVLLWLAAFAALRIWFELAYDYLVVQGKSGIVLLIQALLVRGRPAAHAAGRSIRYGGPGVAAAQFVVALVVVVPLYLFSLRRIGVRARSDAAGRALSPSPRSVPSGSSSWVLAGDDRRALPRGRSRGGRRGRRSSAALGLLAARQPAAASRAATQGGGRHEDPRLPARPEDGWQPDQRDRAGGGGHRARPRVHRLRRAAARCATGSTSSVWSSSSHRIRGDDRPCGSRRALREIAVERGIDVIHGYEWPPGLEAARRAERLPDVAAVCTVMSMAVAPFLPRWMPLVVGTQQISAARAGGGRLNGESDRAAGGPGAQPPRRRGRDRGVPAAWGLDDRPVVVCVSRLVPELKSEGIFTAIEAAAALADTLPFQLVIVGDGSARAEMERAAARTNRRRRPRRRSIFTGELADPRPAYAAADVVLGMGGSALRSLAFGQAPDRPGRARLLPYPDPRVPRRVSAGRAGTASGEGGTGGLPALTAELSALLVDADRRRALGAFGRRSSRSSPSSGQPSANSTIYRDASRPGAEQKRQVARSRSLVRGSRRATTWVSGSTRWRGRQRADDFNAEPVAEPACDPDCDGRPGPARRTDPLLPRRRLGHAAPAPTASSRLALSKDCQVVWVDTPHSILPPAGPDRPAR